MRYLALATDYDGTLAFTGRVRPNAIQAIKRLKASGRRALLVTGRRLDDLKQVFQEFELFDFIVAENGAVIYHPSTRTKEHFAAPFPKSFISELRRLNVHPLEEGEVIVATQTPEKEKLLNAIQNFGLEAQIIFNGNAVMVLPHGVNKATGTEYALRRMGLTFHEVVGMGDSENDHSFLQRCECSIAVANAIPAIREAAVHVTSKEAGDGVEEVINELLENDLSAMAPKLIHNHIELGKRQDGSIVWTPAYGQNLLIAGPSGSGKSTFAAGFIERLLSRQYQICIVDPEGDYGTLRNVVAIGNPKRPPSINEVLGILEDPKISLSVNLLGVPLSDRPEYLAHLLPSLQTMRSRTGRPQWIIIDEAHHMLPSSRGSTPLTLPQQLGETILLTVHPEELSPSILRMVDTVIAVGFHPNHTLARFSHASERRLPGPLNLPTRKEDVIAWQVGANQEPILLETIRGNEDLFRHLRKYAEGDLGNHSFYFRGREGHLNLKAQNLLFFNQISEGLDEATWSHHFKNGDYSRWFRQHVKDEFLADETQRLERRVDLSPQDARTLVCEMIRARYTI
jgi:HAD superfamily hydrolase (TIGR01484 family)